jgi:DNA repair exonuclease SbcCD ATPase subunit
VLIYAARAYLISMSSPGSGETEEWADERIAQFQRERSTILARLQTIQREWNALEEKKAEMTSTGERERDPEIDPDYDLMITRGLARLTGKQELLSKRSEELTRQLKELDRQEAQLTALMTQPSYQDWLDLKRQRDRAMREVAHLEAEMKQLMERMILDMASGE